MNSVITGAGGGSNSGFVKSGTVTVVLTKPVLANGQYTINQGTVRLAAGNQTLWGYNQTSANSYFSMTGGTLDLNGTTQTLVVSSRTTSRRTALPSSPRPAATPPW